MTGKVAAKSAYGKIDKKGLRETYSQLAAQR